MNIAIRFVRSVIFYSNCVHLNNNSKRSIACFSIVTTFNMSGEPLPKQSRSNGKAVMKIGTHDGVFHCDDVLACFMLKLLHPDAEIVRSRNNDILDTCDIVVDVGSIYDPQKNRFDHHQRGFNESMSTVLKDKKWTTKLSSAGLIYCHFGNEIIETVLKNKDDDKEVSSRIFDKVYENFIQEIDGIDNGIPMFDGEPAYRIHTNLSARVHNFNKSWNQVDFDEKEQFAKAMKLAGLEFMDKILYYRNDWWPARVEVVKSIKNRFEVFKTGEIMELENHVPWKGHFFDLEEELGVKPELKFVIFKDMKGAWRVQAVSMNSESFLLRLPLLEEWRGLRDEELSQISGIDGCVFVHHSGFIGGSKTREGALKMAIKTLELSTNNIPASS